MSKTPAVGSRSQTATQTSWAHKVRVSDSSTRFSLEPLSRQPLGHRLVIPEEMLHDNADQWNRCMVGFFPGFKLPYHAVNTIASRVWRKCGLENVTTTSNGFMIFRFTTEAEMHAVLEKGPWMFGGKNIVLQQWHPRFQFDKNNISTIPVWIRLHGLPFPLWSKQGLSMAASMVGRPLSCDEATYNCIRLDYARVCVEVDASLPYVHDFEIDSPLTAEPITVKVDYEWKPSRCAKCHIFGHSCPIATDPLLNKGKSPVTDVIPLPIPVSPIKQTPTEPSTSTQPPTPTAIPLPEPINSVSSQRKTELPLPPMPHTSINPIFEPITITHIPSPIPPQIPMTIPASTLPLEVEKADAELIDLPTKHQPVTDTVTCQENKMASLHSNSASSTACEDSTAETSTISLSLNESHDDSPQPSPKTVRKKKAGKKRKEARGLLWL